MVYPGFDNSRSTAIATREGAINIDMSGGTIYGNGDLNGEATGLPRVRQLNCVFAEDCYFHDMVIEDASDDCFTLGAASHHNIVERVIGRHAGGRVEKIGGNALTDVGQDNIWIDCIADQGGSDGWTPKCQYGTFIRCIAANNNGPGFGMYAREEGYAGNEDVGANIIGNQFIDCVAYGSKRGSGFSFNISSNCPGAIIRDNYIQAVCYDNQKSGVDFRNKDDAETGIIEDNVVDIVCYGNKGLNNSGSINSWAGGLGMENDGSPLHNTIDNITGSVVCYDNSVDVNTKGGQNCNITVYHPEGENEPVLVDTSSYNNTVTVIDFNCADQLNVWCVQAYCPNPPGEATNPLPTPGATDVSLSAQLSWAAGVGAASHTVHFGTSATPPVVSTTQPGTTYDPAPLLLDQTYYWQVDEVNINGTTAGDIWSFTTIPPTPGDFDADGDVDGIDLENEWKLLYGSVYDGSNFLEWQRNYTGSQVIVPDVVNKNGSSPESVGRKQRNGANGPQLKLNNSRAAQPYDFTLATHPQLWVKDVRRERRRRQGSFGPSFKKGFIPIIS